MTVVIAWAVAARAADAPVGQSSPEAQQDLQNLQAELNNPASTTAQRDEAARRLVDRRSTDIILNSFQLPSNQAAQVSIAKALAQDSNPDPKFIAPLEDALGNNWQLTEAAAEALVNYPDGSGIFPVLQKAAENLTLPDRSRVAIVKAMGGIVEKPVAEYLMQTLTNTKPTNPNESQTVQDAAADALAEMTGLTDNGRDRQRWQQWWAGEAAKPSDRWRTDVLGNRVRQFNQLKRRHSELTENLQSILSQEYEATPEAQRPEKLLRYLDAQAAPELRVAGAKQVSDDFLNHTRPIPEAVRQRLRALVGDSDRDVRQAVIDALGDINDRGAAAALITQLEQETDPLIKRKIAAALGRIDDLAAVPALLEMLKDPFYEDDAAAAGALAGLGDKLRQENAPLAKTTVEALQRMLDDPRTADPAALQLRAACVKALATLADPASAETFRKLLRPNESDDVRLAALRGLGAVAQPVDAAVIAAELTDSKPEIRLAAAQALKNVATFAQADELYQMLDPTQEHDERVRQAVWDDLKKVFAGGTAAQLGEWPDRFTDLDEKLAAQMALANALERAQNDPDMADQLADTRQDIGETLMRLNPPQPGEAAKNFQRALDYWQAPQGKNRLGGRVRPNALVTETIEAMLKDRQYDQAITFAQQELSISNAYQDSVGPAIKDEASRLQAAGDAAATPLVDAALKMIPALDAKYQADLQQTQSELAAHPAGARP